MLLEGLQHRAHEQRVAAGVPKALLDHPTRQYREWREVATVVVSWAEHAYMTGPLGECMSRAVTTCLLLCATQLGGYLAESSGGKWLLFFQRVRPPCCCRCPVATCRALTPCSRCIPPMTTRNDEHLLR
jgi:hypothetical protein